jgi:hypothetical protein
MLAAPKLLGSIFAWANPACGVGRLAEQSFPAGRRKVARGDAHAPRTYAVASQCIFREMISERRYLPSPAAPRQIPRPRLLLLKPALAQDFVDDVATENIYRPRAILRNYFENH